MLTLCIIRHGETDWNKLNIIQGREDVELNKKGQEQAKNCGLSLKGSKWDLVITSPLKRAIKTGEIIDEILGIKACEIFTDLIERDFGTASGKSKSEVREKYLDGNIPGSETRDQIKERCAKILKKLESYQDKRIIVVTHAGVVSCILSILEPRTAVQEIPNASVNMVRFENGKWSLEMQNNIQKRNLSGREISI